MTKTELLALADFVAQFSGTQYDGWASDLRKLAALEPVAWAPAWNSKPAQASVRFEDAAHWRSNGAEVLCLYNLTGVIDHE
jgi:hypothetical protein